MKDLIKKILKETINNGKVICDNCGWSWSLNNGGGDKYVCHKCGHDNKPKQSNLDRIVDKFKSKFPVEYQDKFERIKKFVKDYITSNGYNVKFLNACNTGFGGVRTKDQIIVCSPSNMESIGDFLYTIFHEIRHESQVSKIKMDNPLSDYDLDDFEKIYKQYWEMELDADQFAKNMVGKLIRHLDIPIDIAKEQFSLSPYIKNYPSMSKMIESSLRQIVDQIKIIKKSGGEYEDIQDHPIVKRHLDKLESLI